MARKKAASLEEQRNRIKRQYKRGTKVERVRKNESAMTDVEKLVKQEVACYLKAQDFSYTYIAEALHTTKDVVKKWFADPELGMAARVIEIQDDFAQGAIKLMKSYVIELVEMLMEIARTTNDESLVLKIATEFFDRVGIAKVNKSESISAQTIREERSVDITDRHGLLESMKDAAPEAQAAVAEKLQEIFDLAPATEAPDEQGVT